MARILLSFVDTCAKELSGSKEQETIKKLTGIRIDKLSLNIQVLQTPAGTVDGF